MARGVVALANSWANTIRGGGAGTSYTAPAAVYIKLHTGDPGAAGTSNASANTTRQAATFGAASSGAIALTNTPSWATWAAGTETITDISCWDASTSGNCLWTGTLSGGGATVNNGDTLNLTACTFTVTPAS